MFFSTAATSVAALLMICACRFDASSMCRHSSYDHARHRDFVGTLTARRSSRNQMFRVCVVRCRVKIYWRLKLPMQRGSKRQGQRQGRRGVYGGIYWPALHTCSYTTVFSSPWLLVNRRTSSSQSASVNKFSQVVNTLGRPTGTFYRCVIISEVSMKSNERPLQKSAAMYCCILAALFSWNRQLLPGYYCCVPLPEHSFTFSANRLRREFAQRRIMMRDLLSRSRAGKSSACVPIPQARFKTIAFDDGCLTHYASALIAPCLCQPPKTWPRCAASAVPSSSHSLTR